VGGDNSEKSISSLIYNLAFSPKLRILDLTDSSYKCPDRKIADSLAKLLQISGSIEYLILDK